MPSFKFEGEDGRGKVWSFKIGELEYILFQTHDDCLRGGDFHLRRQYNVILKGSVFFTQLNYGVETTELLHEGDMITIEGGTPHYMKSNGQSYVLEWHELPKERQLWNPYRILVIQNKRDVDRKRSTNIAKAK